MPTTEQRNYYASRAADARSLAEGEPDPKTRAALDELADSYEKLVTEADRILLIRSRIAEPGALPGDRDKSRPD
jgi:hypothetical protein